MSLMNQVTTGKRLKPICILFYGVHGIGKTTFPSEAPNPIYIGPEENDEIDAARLPRIMTWDQLEAQLKSIRDDKHEFKTLVIDTIDTLEQVAQKKILTGSNAGKNMETAMGGYGKAYKSMADMFLKIRDEYLVPIRDKRRMNIIILSHAEKSKHEDPMTNTSYDTFSLSMHKKVKPIFEDWVSAILFANYILLKAERADGREYVEGLDGKREIYTEERPAFIAKNRYNLPFEIDFPKEGAWGIFSAYVREYFKGAPKAEPAAKPEAPANVSEPQSEPENTSGNDVGNDAKTEEPVSDVSPEPEEKSEEPTLANVMAHVDELFLKMPESAKGSIQTAIKRAALLKDEVAKKKEFLRLKTKMEGVLK